jgi:hypothetical protein
MNIRITLSEEQIITLISNRISVMQPTIAEISRQYLKLLTSNKEKEIKDDSK